MHAYVFTDAALQRDAGRFVWLSLDTEKEVNAAFLERYPVEAWPSLYVIDPKTGEVVLRWLGSLTVPQLQKFLEDGAQAVRGGAEGAQVLLVRANKAYGQQDKALAAQLYRQVLERTPQDWPQRPRVVEQLLLSQLTSHEEAACVQVARAEVPKLAMSASRANAAATGLGCALALPQEALDRADARAELEKLTLEAVKAATADPPTLQIAADDVSGFYELLVQAHDEAGDEAGKQQLARDWATFLEKKAADAKTPEQRTVFDPHRLEAYLALGQPERALPMLEASEQALPQDYNPPARLAVAYQALGRYDDALAANDRALQRVYGPRKLRVLQNRAQILEAKGDAEGAHRTLQQALAHFDALPKGQQHPSVRARLEKALAALSAQAPTPKK